MTGLVLLLTGPLQSWGERAVFGTRDTLPHPTRSGIIGMLAAALGQSRDADLSWAVQLRINVRADQPGTILRDYHTIGGGYPSGTGMVTADGRPRKDKNGRSAGTISTRYYLADAAFTVTVHADDSELIDRLAHALSHPRWPLALGRRSCPPAHPVLLGTTTQDPVQLLTNLPVYSTTPAHPGVRERTPLGDTLTGAAVEVDVTDELFVDSVPQTLPGGNGQLGLDEVDWVEAYANPDTTTRTVVDGGGADTQKASRATREVMLYLEAEHAASATTLTRDVPHTFHPERRAYSTRAIATRVAACPIARTGVHGWADLAAHLTT